MDPNILENSVQSIIHAVDKGDVIATVSQSTPVDFDMDHLKSIEDINRFSIGLRLFHEGRIGNSAINSIEDEKVLVANARQSAELGDKLDFELPGPSSYPDLGLYHQEVIDYTKEQAIALGQEMVHCLKSIDDKAKVSVGVSQSTLTHYLANTSGFKGQFSETHFGMSASMNLVDDDGGLLFVGDGDSAFNLSIDQQQVCENIEWRYTHAKNKVSVKSGYFPVLFAPEALGVILEPIEIAANGKTLYKGISVLADKVGQEICDKRFSLTDDALYANGMSSYPFDDEGVVPNRLPIIENGVFQNYIFDLATARRMDRKSTGHGSRGTSSLPAPSFSNLLIAAGESSLKDMIAGMDYGIIVYEFLGGGMSNVLAGDFSVNIELGYLVEKGKVKGRVKDAMLSGNAFEILKKIEGLENKVHKKGGLYAPHILFKQVSIAG